MNFFEAMCFARVYGAACGQIDKNTISKQEVDVTIEFLKKFTDNRNDWTQEQKDYYKLMADYVKENIKQDIDRINSL